MALTGYGALIAATLTTCSRIVYPQKDLSKQDKTTLDKRSRVMSQAVFILPACLEQDSVSAQYGYQIRDEFERLGVPAFMVGDSTGVTPDELAQNIKNIQQQFHFTAVTFLSLTHGELYDNKRSERIDSTSRLKPWQITDEYLQSGRVTHYTRIGRSEMSGGKQETGELMKLVTDAANVNGDLEKDDYVSFSCYSGAVTQKTVNNLKNKSVYLAASGCNQVNFFGAQIRLLGMMRHNRFDVSRGVNAGDFAFEMTRTDLREYDAETRLGVSGEKKMVVLPAASKGNVYYSETAFLTNAGQFFLLQKAGVTRSKPRAATSSTATVSVQPE